ncbi:hypothetical protein V8D89_000820 [Ganoderma adspersum]
MIETFSSSWRSLKTTATASWQGRSRSASLSSTPSSSHTGRYEGDIGVQKDLDQHLVVGTHEQILQEARAAAETWKKRAQEAEERTRSAEARLAEANRRHDAERATFERARQAERQVSEAEDRVNHLQAALAQSRQELRRTNDELQGTVALLDRRSAELRDAQAYLSRPDDVADGEVLRLVEGINSRVFQAAANIADAFQSRYGEQRDIPQEAVARVQHLFGDSLLSTLFSIDHSGDSLGVQTVLQAIMVFHTRWLCATWDFNVTGRRKVLQNIYHLIRRTEQQSVAGRWRALSRTYVKMFLEDNADRERRDVGALVRDITDILLVCGIAATPQDLRTEVESSYANALRELVHLSLEFQRITGEAIISRDLLILVPRPGEPFDPSGMVDEWTDPRAPNDYDAHPVLCTTQLGLVREEKTATEGAGGEEGIVTVTLLKPKVVLTSFLEELRSNTGS